MVFLSECNARGRSEPIFILEIRETKRGERPEPLQKRMPIRFWQRRNSKIPLAWPIPDPENQNHEEFYIQVSDLAEKVNAKLEFLRDQALEKSAPGGN